MSIEDRANYWLKNECNFASAKLKYKLCVNELLRTKKLYLSCHSTFFHNMEMWQFFLGMIDTQIDNCQLKIISAKLPIDQKKRQTRSQIKLGFTLHCG